MYLDVLYVIKRGVQKPTLIMYGSNLDWERTRRILGHMVQEGLIAVELQPRNRNVYRVYTLTPKGQELLQSLARISDWERKAIEWKNLQEAKK